MQENCTSGLPSGDWKREGILSVRQPVCAPVVDSTEDSPLSGQVDKTMGAKQVARSNSTRAGHASHSIKRDVQQYLGLMAHCENYYDFKIEV